MASAHHSPSLPVTNVVVTTVKPAEKTTHVETIDPTFLDIALKDGFIPVFFAYRHAGESGALYFQLLNRIKESLQKVLIPFFPFAGRCIVTPSGSGRQILCNDAGVPFIEAYADRDLESIPGVSAEFQPVPELQGYNVLGMDASQFRAEMLPDGLPCMFVQLTRFKCGGVVVAVTWNHMVNDGRGFFNFMRAWSDISRTNETTATMDHNRALLVTSYPHLGLPQEGHLDMPNEKLEIWAMKTFEVSASTIVALKQEAKSSKEGSFVSTVDCITAHIWKSVSRLSSSVLREKKPLATLAVEGRSKFFDTPQPNLCGNFLSVLIPPKIPINELLEMSLVSIALMLREKLQTTSKETWFAPERLMEAGEVFASGNYATLQITSWFDFPMYEVDFGFGKPFFSGGPNSFASVKNALGCAVIGSPIPGTPNSAATLSFWSTREVIDGLLNTPDFLSLFSQNLEHES